MPRNWEGFQTFQPLHIRHQKILCESNSRRRDYLEWVKLEKLSLESVLTRWRTWLECASYHLNNFVIASNFVLNYGADFLSTAKSDLEILLIEKISNLKRLFGNLEIFSVIEKLESHSLEAVEQLRSVEYVRDAVLNHYPRFKAYFAKKIQNNPDLESFMSE